MRRETARRHIGGAATSRRTRKSYTAASGTAPLRLAEEGRNVEADRLRRTVGRENVDRIELSAVHLRQILRDDAGAHLLREDPPPLCANTFGLVTCARDDYRLTAARSIASRRSECEAPAWEAWPEQAWDRRAPRAPPTVTIIADDRISDRRRNRTIRRLEQQCRCPRSNLTSTCVASRLSSGLPVSRNDHAGRRATTPSR